MTDNLPVSNDVTRPKIASAAQMAKWWVQHHTLIVIVYLIVAQRPSKNEVNEPVLVCDYYS